MTEVEPRREEEIENAAQSEAAPAEPIVESANATEATEESLRAAETNEKILAEAEPAPVAAETAHATEARDTGDVPTNTSAPLFDPKPTLYIGNLFFDVTETDIVKEFARFGTVTHCRIVRDSRGLSKG